MHPDGNKFVRVSDAEKDQLQRGESLPDDKAVPPTFSVRERVELKGVEFEVVSINGPVPRLVLKPIGWVLKEGSRG